MTGKEIIIVADYNDQSLLHLEEICAICRVPTQTIYALVDYEIIHPRGETPNEWVFDLDELKRIRTALRLQRELEVNLQGVALMLQLKDEMEELRLRLALLEKHFSRL